MNSVAGAVDGAAAGADILSWGMTWLLGTGIDGFNGSTSIAVGFGNNFFSSAAIADEVGTLSVLCADDNV